MGFTESYLERRKKRTGQSLSAGAEKKGAAGAASSGSGDDFTARYLARREERAAAPEVPALVLPSLPGITASAPAAKNGPAKIGTTGGKTGTDTDKPASKQPSGGTVDFRGPEWARRMADRYKPENNQNIRENPVAAERRKQTAGRGTGQPAVDFRGIPLEYSPDRVTSGLGERKTPSILDRAGAALAGAAKSYGASLASGQANLYDLSQGTRDAMDQEMLEGARLAYDRALRDYQETEALAKKYPGDQRRQRDLEASRNLLEAAKRDLEAYEKVPEAQRGAAAGSYEASDRLAQSGQEDVERAKDGLSSLGQFAVDVGVGGAQMAADIGLGLASGGGTMLPLMARSFGGGAQEARQEGAAAGQAAAFGAASALTEMLTEKISSLGNFNTKAFGEGALDDILEGAVAAVERMGKSDAGRKILNHAASAGVGFLSEGAEEFVSGIVSPLLKLSIYSKEPVNWKEVIQEAGYEFLTGGAIGAISGGIGGTSTGDIQQAYLSKATEQAQNNAYQTMAEKGMFSPEARAAARDAVGQMDTARERSGVPGLQPPTLEEFRKGQQEAQEGQGVPESTQVPGTQQNVQNGPQTGQEGIKNTAPAGTEAAQKEKTIVEHLHDNAQAIMEMKPVANLTGDELPKQGKATDRAMAFLQQIGNKVTREGFGEVLFSRSKIKTALVGHGVSEAKIETIAAVPEVIRNGVVLNQIANYNGRGYDTYVFGAPVIYKGRPVLVGAVVSKDQVTGRYYVHEVVDSDGNIILDSKEPEGNADRTPDRDDPVIPSGSSIAPSTRTSVPDAAAVQPVNTEGAGIASSDISADAIVQPAPSKVNPVNSVENAESSSQSAVMMLGRLVRMGEKGETAARLGDLLGRVMDGQQLTAGEWNEINANPNAARLGPLAQELAKRNQTGGQQNGETEGIRLPDGRGDRGTAQDTGGPAGAVSEGAEPGAAAGKRGGQAAVDGTAQGIIADRRSGRQSVRAIERQNAVTDSGARAASTREYMGLDTGSDRPCLFEAPEEVIRSDRVLSEVYDEIWEMGYRPHMFTGTPEMVNSNFSFNGMVRGEDVYIRIDHARYDADAIWDHEKFHILSAEDPGLRASVRDAVLEKYSEEELAGRLETYLEKYRGAYGLENIQGLTELSDSELDLILEELLADAYAGKDTYSAGVAEYRDTVRDMASQRENEGRMVRGPPEETRFDIGYDRNNRPFVTVEEDILEGVPRKDWVRTVKDNLRKKFPSGVTVGNSEIQINNQSRQEMTFSRYMQELMRTDQQKYADKLRSTNNADEILKATRDWVNESLLHPRKDAMQDFARGNVQLRISGNEYIAEVIVGSKNNGKMLLYDIINLMPTNIQEKQRAGANYITKPQEGTGNRQYTPADDTLPHPAPDVKPLELRDSRDYSKAGTGPAEIPAGSDVPGLRLPGVEKNGESVDNTRFSADEDRKNTPAEQRKIAVRKLADDLTEIFPETQKSYLRDIADEIRAGASGDRLEALFNDTYDSAKVYDESPESAELREIAHELRGRRVYVDPSVREEFGDDWNNTRKFFFGKGVYFTTDKAGMGLDQLNAEMAGRFGGRFHENETDMSAVVSRLEYILQGAASRQIPLDEQARRFGGEEAAQKFREAYRQRFMDAAEGYRDTINGTGEAQRTARESERQRRRQELEDYLAQARQTLRERAEKGMDTSGADPRTHVPEGMDIDQYVDSLQQRAAQAREERMKTVLREDFRGSGAMENLGVRITGSVTDDYQNAGEIRKRSAAAEQAKKAVRLAEKRLKATEAEKQFAAGITAGYYTEQDIPRTMDAGKIMELADYYMGERAFGFDLLKQRRADISRAQQQKAKDIFGPALEESEGKRKLIGGVLGKLGEGFALNNRTAERNTVSVWSQPRLRVSAQK